MEDSCAPEDRQHLYKKPYPGGSPPGPTEPYYHPSSYAPPLSGHAPAGLSDAPYSADVGQRQACMFASPEPRLEELGWSYACPLPPSMTPMDYPPYSPHGPYSSSPQGSRLSSGVAHHGSPPLGDPLAHAPYQNQSSAGQDLHSRRLTPPPLREYSRFPSSALSPPLYHTLEAHPPHARGAVPEWSSAS